MKIIAGLGNPGEKYEDTRHNVGFFYLDKMRDRFSLSAFETNKKFQAETSKGMIDSTEVLLVKPQTFMNLSGQSVRSALDFYKLSPEDLIVIHDDLDIGLGKYKIATDSSSAGHNGVQNIIDMLGTKKFIRIRVGIGRETEGSSECRLGAHDFVLGRFTEEEIIAIENIFEKIMEEISEMIRSDTKNS